ncbi:MAG: lysozyme inhibitor LprI family protein [Chthoniobacterales bacterium]
MRFPCLTAALFCLFVVADSGYGQTKDKIIPTDWLPALSPSINSALQQLKEANSQAEMNSLSRQVADMTDAQLFIAYVRLYERLSAKEREKLVQEQTAWLKKRPKVAKAGIESEGGSLAPLEANNAEVTYTEKRLAELRARLKEASKKAGGTDD